MARPRLWLALTATFDYDGRTWALRSSPPFDSAALFPAVGAEGAPYGPNFYFELAKVP